MTRNCFSAHVAGPSVGDQSAVAAIIQRIVAAWVVVKQDGRWLLAAYQNSPTGVV